LIFTLIEVESKCRVDIFALHKISVNEGVLNLRFVLESGDIYIYHRTFTVAYPVS